MRKLFGPDYLSSCRDLAAGPESNIEEIRSAVSAIPPSAISSGARVDEAGPGARARGG